MYDPYSEEHGLNWFLLLSVILHAVLFFAVPNLSSVFDPDLRGAGGGGIIQIMHVESSANARLSPVVDPLSQSTIPRVTEPRPLPEQEEQPAPAAEAIADSPEPETAEPQAERGKPTTPGLDSPADEPAQEKLVVDDKGGILTSPEGPEIVVEADEYSDPKSPDEDDLKPGGVSGSGEGVAGEADVAGPSQSGEGAAESAPPIPAPPRSGRSQHLGGGAPIYPKDAEHDGVEGVVHLNLEVSADGKLQAARISRSSGDIRLDLQAKRHIELVWAFRPEDYDYLMDVKVIFHKEESRFTSSLGYGEVEWINVP